MSMKEDGRMIHSLRNECSSMYFHVGFSYGLLFGFAHQACIGGLFRNFAFRISHPSFLKRFLINFP